MSTAPEVIVARQCHMRCFSLALVTNVCIMDDDDTTKEEHTHVEHTAGATAMHRTPQHTTMRALQDEVISVGSQQAANVQRLFRGMIAEIAATLASKTN